MAVEDFTSYLRIKSDPNEVSACYGEYKPSLLKYHLFSSEEDTLLRLVGGEHPILLDQISASDSHTTSIKYTNTMYNISVVQ